MSETVIPCPDLKEALDFFVERLGFRLEMIFPADAPAVAIISGHGIEIRLEKSEPPTLAGGFFDASDLTKPLCSPEAAGTADALGIAAPWKNPPANAGGSDMVDKNPSASAADTDIRHSPIISRADDAKWVAGRAGMEYCDLIPDRLNGRLAAAVIRLGAGGEAADYVHYHKVSFQMIYCWHGKVRVVYEDQGDPFWLHPGDCVLQPPEMRHRVLESAAGTLVVELTSPAVQETWVDHDMTLPTGRLLPDRIFGGQTFVHHKAADSTSVSGEFGDFESHHFGIATATGGALRVVEFRTRGEHSTFESDGDPERNTFYFTLSGRVTAAFDRFGEHKFTPGDSILIPPHTAYRLNAPANSEILCVVI